MRAQVDEYRLYSGRCAGCGKASSSTPSAGRCAGPQGHLLRDFNRIRQRGGLAGQIGRRLPGLGFVMFRRREKRQLAGQRLARLQRWVCATLGRGVQQGRCSRSANTCANSVKLWPALCTVTANPALAPTNNAAEQALRSLVLKRKISGPTRSLRGDQFLSRGFSVHETCLRQGVDLRQFMHQGKRSANPIFPANPEPANLVSIATTRGRSGFGSATAGAVLGAGGGLPGVGLEGHGMGRGQWG